MAKAGGRAIAGQNNLLPIGRGLSVSDGCGGGRGER